MIENVVDEVTKKVKTLSAGDISHKELGSKLGFPEAQKVVQDVCTQISNVLERYRLRKAEISQVLAEDVLSSVNSFLGELGSYAQKLNDLASQVNSTNNYASQRQSRITQFQDAQRKIESALAPLELKIENLELKELISQSTPDSQRLSEALAKAERDAERLDMMVKAQSEKAARAGVDEASTGFGDLRSKHKETARYWFLAMLFFALAARVAIAHAIFVEPADNEMSTLVSYVFRKLLLIGALLAALRACLVKFNVERNLQILYDHRQTVLDQYPSFDLAIPDDSDTKHQFRLEVAKFIFSDPVTGYTAVRGGSELNINPIIGAVEKGITKGS